MLSKAKLAAFAAPVVMFIGGTADAAVSVGQSAPNFTLPDLGGRKVSLADFKGKYVVLEWHNPKCPFVVKHYGSGNMQATQQKVVGADTVWLTVNSTNPKHGDYLAPTKLASLVKDAKATPTAYLMDEDGKVGNLYSAKTTPHMYIIDPKGNLIYNGAIDDKRSANPADIAGARNYVLAAMSEAKAGKPVSVASNAPYGCSVKY
jgi:hypothetical protein